MMGAKWNIIVTVFHNFFSMNIKTCPKGKKQILFLSCWFFFFYHVNFIIDQLSVMQNNFKYWVSCIGIINKYALLSELDKGIIQSWPMGALPSQTLNLLTILFSMLFWWRSENSATVQDSMAFLPIMRKGHFGEWLWCSALKIKTIFFSNYQ